MPSSDTRPRLASLDRAMPRRPGFLETSRTDLWWVPSLLTFLGFSAFIVYSTWAAFQNANYHFGNYISPMYSPELFGDSPHAWFGPKPGFIPAWVPWSPALLILWAPGGFRFTCYYYRGAYYKAFWADPVGCAVGEPRNEYRGEAKLPLIFQNIHRYFLYLALVFIGLLAYDAWKGLWFDDGSGTKHFGLAVGSIVLILNVVFLSSYTFGCHSLRHLVGGFLDKMSGKPVKQALWKCVSCYNRWHMKWAWVSLFWVGFTDFYVRMCASGVFHDWRFF